MFDQKTFSEIRENAGEAIYIPLGGDWRLGRGPYKQQADA
jgi:hypothetical protein